ncbi:acriflavine resistance protein B [Bacteroidia bacterium]|nr:acriflavine resistance protein B [Bacteroidia bacterium]
MNQITKFAVKYPVTVLMLTLAICLLGMISYNKLGTDLFPDMKNPALYIELQAGERPPEEMEKQFVKNIEALAARQDGVKQVSSSTSVGTSRITVEYDWKQDMDAAFLDLQRGLSTIGRSTEITTLNVVRYDINAKPVVTISLTHKDITDMNELRKVAENYMRSELVRIDGVADIQLNGPEEAIVEVKTDPYLLEAYNLTVDVVATKIGSLLRNVSGGTITNEDIRYTVKGVNIIKSLEDIGNIIVAFKEVPLDAAQANSGQSNTKAPIYLKDVAAVAFANEEPNNITRFDGQRCIGISVYKENKYNTVQVVENLNVKLEELHKSMPGYTFEVIENQGEFINASISEVKDSAILGIILAVIVLYFFLRRVNTTLIVSLSIPISIIATFNLMYFNGLTINIMTLGGLALGAGMLIDNSIVVVENIFRNLETGMSPKDASVRGTSEVGGAIVSSTLTTIVVFLPIVYVQGAAGELFKDQAWTVTFSLLSSLFVAVLLIPMLASQILKNSSKSTQSLQIKGYGNFVGKLLDHRKGVIITAFLLTVATYALIPFLGMEFMPKAESTEFSVKITMDPGTRLQATDLAASSIDGMIRDLAGEDLEWIYTLTGPSNTETEITAKAEEENQSELKVKLKKGATMDADAIIAAMLASAQLPEGVEISYEKEQSALQDALGIEGAPVSVEIKGDEIEILDQLSHELKDKMVLMSGLFDLKTSMEKGAPEVNISIDRLRSGIYGINIATVAQQVSEKLGGKNAGSFDYSGEPVNIEIKVPEISLSELNNIEILQGDKSYRLGEIADVSIERAPREILRSNQNRVANVTAMLDKSHSLSTVTPAILSALNEIEFPAKYSAKITGEEEKRAESFGGLGMALILSILLVYMVMAAQFESLLHPFTIILSIPLAGVGAILAFLITDTTLNMMAFIGIIMLAGIAVNSAIIFVDRINQLKGDGIELREAVMMAAQQRIRPIIMTSSTTILALLPMCFGFGEGASLRSPMALAVIGGLLTSTLLTLVIIPCVYYVFDRKKSR